VDRIVTPELNSMGEITGGGNGMAFLRQEARVVERFRIIEAAEAESATEAARRLRNSKGIARKNTWTNVHWLRGPRWETWKIRHNSRRSPAGTDWGVGQRQGTATGGSGLPLWSALVALPGVCGAQALVPRVLTRLAGSLSDSKATPY
jgi:hypothetical protein